MEETADEADAVTSDADDSSAEVADSAADEADSDTDEATDEMADDAAEATAAVTAAPGLDSPATAIWPQKLLAPPCRISSA